eukprot:1193482-Amphidinium_carterae.1
MSVFGMNGMIHSCCKVHDIGSNTSSWFSSENNEPKEHDSCIPDCFWGCVTVMVGMIAKLRNTLGLHRRLMLVTTLIIRKQSGLPSTYLTFSATATSAQLIWALCCRPMQRSEKP